VTGWSDPVKQQSENYDSIELFIKVLLENYKLFVTSLISSEHLTKITFFFIFSVFSIPYFQKAPSSK